MTTKSTSPNLEEESEERAAGFVLFRNCGEDEPYFLVLKHLHGGHWGFPKGRHESGEDDRTAAEREVGEETGIGIEQPIPAFRWVSRYRFHRNGSAISKTVVYFLGRAEDEPVRLSAEHTDYAWLRGPEARERLTHEENRRILDAAVKALRAAGRKEGEDGDVV